LPGALNPLPGRGEPPAAGKLENAEHARLVAFFRSRHPCAETQPPPILPEPYFSLSGRSLSRRPRALILDVYGTLLASAAGEVGSASELPDVRLDELAVVLEEFGVSLLPEDFETALKREVLADHAKSRGAGIPYPEVDASDIFARVSGLAPAEARFLGAAREAVLNPAAPMPGAEEILAKARGAGLALGIVSNAQYYTHPLLEAAFGASLADMGIEEDLCVWSWRLGRAKPDIELFHILARGLAARGISPGQALYVGNDLLNDMLPARDAGYGTALFAGDARSLRLREGDARTAGLLPDIVIPSFHGAETSFCLAD
jgi:putative hydrolase of the HAD superfamily